MARWPSVPAYKHRQAVRRKRYEAAQEVKLQAKRKLPWLLGFMGLLMAMFMAGAVQLYTRSTHTLATLTRAEGVLSWVEVRREDSRYQPYMLRLTVENQTPTLEKYLGQNEQYAARFANALHVGDSVRVYYDTESPGNLSFIYQLEKGDDMLLVLQEESGGERAGAVGFGLLSLLPLALLLPNRQFRTQMKTYWTQMMMYFRRRAA